MQHLLLLYGLKAGVYRAIQYGTFNGNGCHKSLVWLMIYYDDLYIDKAVG